MEQLAVAAQKDEGLLWMRWLSNTLNDPLYRRSSSMIRPVGLNTFRTSVVWSYNIFENNFEIKY